MRQKDKETKRAHRWRSERSRTWRVHANFFKNQSKIKKDKDVYWTIRKKTNYAQTLQGSMIRRIIREKFPRKCSGQSLHKKVTFE